MKTALVPLAMSLPLVTAISGTAHADGVTRLHADLTPLNGSGARGSATVVLAGDRATVTIKSNGLVANLPHAQHFHIGGTNTCPTEAADEDDDGRLSTSEGAPSYGPVRVALTTRGDASADSGLAIERMPIADRDGNVSYHREFTVPDEFASAIRAGRAVIVQHGVDYNESGEYDGAVGSDLDQRLPAEATDPAVCGELNPVPAGAVAAGGGGAAGPNGTLAALGGALLAVAASVAFAFYRLRVAR